MAKYTGLNDGHYRFAIWKDGGPFLPGRSLKVRNHSPDGFSWGYGGSGPAQLALAILLEETDEYTARHLYQVFKSSVVAGWPRSGFSYTSEQVRAWLQGHTP